MTIIAVAIGGTAIIILYNVAFEQQRARLIETVRSQARLMEAVARFDQQHTVYPLGPRSATLAQIAAAHNAFQLQKFDKHIQLVLAQRQGEDIVFLLRPNTKERGDLESLPWDSSAAEPARLALSGHSGSMLTRNADNVRVLTAFDPVAVLDLGIMAEMSIASIRRPFIAAGTLLSGIGVALVATGSLLFFAIGEPMIRRLRENESSYRRLFDSSPSPKFILDPETTHLVNFNAALISMTGYSREKLSQLPLSVFEAKVSPAEIKEIIAHILAEGAAEFETQWRARNGEILTITVNACALELAGRQVIHCVLTDLTARIRIEKRARDLQDQLQRATRANELGQMASSLAHELKQPLTAALNYINATRRFLRLREETALDRAEAASVKAAEQIGRADHFIRGLRDYVRHKDPVREAASVETLVVEAIELASIGAADIDMRLHLAPDLPVLYVDRMQIQQVLLNLLRNAIEAVANRPIQEIAIEVLRSEPAAIEIVIRDSGPGLSPEIAERLFQPFVTTKPDGLGIGLSISYAIVRAHDGKLWAENDNNSGAIFRLSLPVDLDRPENHHASGDVAA